MNKYKAGSEFHACEAAEAADELERLRTDAAVVEFLSRDDITIMWGYTHETFKVYQRDWLFEGEGANVIVAARMAMHMEQKRKAEAAKET